MPECAGDRRCGKQQSRGQFDPVTSRTQLARIQRQHRSEASLEHLHGENQPGQQHEIFERHDVLERNAFAASGLVMRAMRLLVEQREQHQRDSVDRRRHHECVPLTHRRGDH